MLTAILAGLAPCASAADLGWTRGFADSPAPLQVRSIRDWSQPLIDNILVQDGYSWTILDSENRLKWQFGSQIKTNLEHLAGPFNIERMATNSSDFSDVNGDGKRDLLFACISSVPTGVAYSMRLYDVTTKNLLWQTTFQQPILAAVSGKLDNKKALSVVVRSGTGYDSTTQTYSSRTITVLDGATGKAIWTRDLGSGGLFGIALDDWDHQGLMNIRVQDQNRTLLFHGRTFAQLWSVQLAVPTGWSFATMVNRAPTGPADYTISDVDGDGYPDMLVTARPSDNTPATMIQLYNIPDGTLKWTRTIDGSVNMKIKSLGTNREQQIIVNTYKGNIDTATSNNVLSVLSGTNGTTEWAVDLGSSSPGTLILDPNKDGRYQILAPLSNSMSFYNAGDGSVARQLPLTPPDSSIQTWRLISFGPSFQYGWGGEAQLIDMDADNSTDLAVVWRGSSGAYCFQVYDINTGSIASQMVTADGQNSTQFNNNRMWLNPDPVSKQVYATQSYNSGAQYYYNRALNLFDPTVPPQFTSEPQDQTGRAGSTFVLSASATGSRPLHYQWSLNGRKLAGATNASLTLRNAQPSGTGIYSVSVTNRAGLQTRTAVLTVIETNPPVVTIISPAAGQSVASPSCVFSGSASDKSGVSNVLWSVNGSDFTSAAGVNAWTFVADLQPGSNSVSVKAIDFYGNESIPVKRPVFYTVKLPITLTVSGPGKIVPGFTGTNLVVGQRYTVRAIPTGSQPFSGWSGGILSSNPSISFIMAPNLSLTASFGTNPFANSQGIYSGLFYETNRARQQSSGYLTVNLSGNGGFTGRILNANGVTPLSGWFGVNGRAEVVSSYSQGWLTNSMALDFEKLTMNGAVSGAGWSSALQAFRATTNPAFSGNYTLAILPPQIPASGPLGAGYATVTVDACNTITMVGRLADGISISQQTSLSPQGLWPFYAPLYSGGGSVFGWLQFQTNGLSVDGRLIWICPANASLPDFSSGFTNSVSATGSPYSYATARALNLSEGALILTGGNLSETISNHFALDAANAFHFVDSTNNLQIAINTKNGLVTGSFHDAVHDSIVPIQGVILQSQLEAIGYFLGTNESGLFQITR